MRQKMHQKRFTLNSMCLHGLKCIAEEKGIAMSAVLKSLIDSAYQMYIVDKEGFMQRMNKGYLYIAIKQCKGMNASQKAKILSIYERIMP